MLRILMQSRNRRNVYQNFYNISHSGTYFDSLFRNFIRNHSFRVLRKILEPMSFIFDEMTNVNYELLVLQLYNYRHVSLFHGLFHFSIGSPL